MSIGNPHLSPQSPSLKSNELVRSKQEIEWQQRRAEMDKIVDATGRGIDEGIKDTVVAFNVNGITTSASCEGHPEVEGGHRPWPWVEVASPDEPEERFIGEIQVFENVARDHAVSVEALKKGHPEELYWEVREKVSKNPLTLEYQEWERKNKELYTQVVNLLDEFYKNKEVDVNIRLQAEHSDGALFEVSSEDSSLVVKFLDNTLADDEKRKLLEKLPQRQKEMRDFTDFLKVKFLTNK